MMAEQLIFFEKNKADLSDSNVTATASQGALYSSYPLNRSNNNAWITTGSVDADNTTFDVDFADARTFDSILLLKHNFKAFTVKYWDGAAYQDFSPAISKTVNTAASSQFTVASVSTSKIRITITGTMVANADKYLHQFIATELIGQLAGWPMIKNPIHSRNKRITKMLSGKSNVMENIGAFSFEASVKEWKSAADLLIWETLFGLSDGFLVWPCGGDETQFWARIQGYRLEDIFLMKCANDYEPELAGGIYSRGLDLKLRLIEVIE